MLLFIILTIVYCIAIFFDLVPIFKSRKYKIAWIYSLILVVAYILQTMLIFGVEIPSINVAIADFFKLFIKT